jgi:hypothetical protein
MSQTERPPDEEIQEAIARHKQEKAQTPWIPVLMVVTVVSLLAAAVFATLFWVQADEKVDTLAQTNDAQRQQFITCQQLPKTDPRCKTPVAPPATKIVEVPITITPEAIPPSDSQVQTAVNAYCANGRCGRGPTPQQVAAAVATYCNARGQCTPKPIVPSPGKDGKPGENATDSQVATAVANYCNAEAQPCRSNIPGKDGKPGADGKNGRSISVSTEALEDGTGTKITISYSDGTPSVSFIVLNGKVGPAGPPGPVCPTDATLEPRTIISTEHPDGELVYVCVKH